MKEIRPIKWIHANKVIDILSKLRSSASDKEYNNRRYEKTKEASVAAAYLIHKMLHDNTDWYIRKNDIQNSVDDIYSRSFHLENRKPISSRMLSIQIFRLTEFDGSLLDAIKKKLKHDLKNVVLVCQIVRDDILDWKKLNSELKKIKPDVISIGIVARVESSQFVAGDVYPVIRNHTLDLNNLPYPKLPEIIEAREVISTKNAELTNGGQVWISTELDIKKSIK